MFLCLNSFLFLIKPVRLPTCLWKTENFFVCIFKSGHVFNMNQSINIAEYFHLQNVNVTPTVSAPSFVTLAEDTPSGSSIFQFFVNDTDSQDTLTVNVECEGQIGVLFVVTDTGKFCLFFYFYFQTSLSSFYT